MTTKKQTGSTLNSNSVRGKLKKREVLAETRAKISAKLKGVPKKHTSWLKGRKGPLHPAYKHGMGNVRASTEKDLKLLGWWKKNVLAKTNYKCFLTGQETTSNDPLVCHHLFSWDKYPDLRFDLNNGIALKRSIHSKFHSIYGSGNNTRDEFEVFCTKYFACTSYPWTQGNHEPNFTIGQLKAEVLTKKEKQEKNLQALVESRGHRLVEGKYQNYNSKVTIFCTKHNQNTKTTYHNYKRSVFGCICCAREKQSRSVAKANRLRKNKNRAKN